MGKVTGFKEFKRQNFSLQPPNERIKHYHEFTTPLELKEIENQGARCMDCGIPFCHSNYGCPLGNLIPQFNDQIYLGQWENAFRSLMSTNNFPEITGRVCPAPCESACVLGLNDTAVGIKNIEYSIIEKAYENGWMKAQKPIHCTGKKVAIIGSGPAGLAAANQLSKAGHTVTVYEKDARIGGLVRYGIPNFKLDKQKVMKRRVDLMEAEGVRFVVNTHIGVDITLMKLQKEHDAIVIAIGAGKPRDLPIPNRDANNIHFAMEFLSAANSKIEEDRPQHEINAKDKHVVVIGGGDTGSDCVGNSVRQGAKSITQIELLPQAPTKRDASTPWPLYPRVFKLSTSQEEGCKMQFCILSKAFIKDDNNNVKALECVKIEWKDGKFSEIKGSEFIIKADLVLLAMGFLGPNQDDVIKEFSLEVDNRSNIQTKSYKTSIDGIFSAGDCRRGQSLVVWAIHEGRECARVVDEYLMGQKSMLNAKDKSLDSF